MGVERYVQCRLTEETHGRLSAYLAAVKTRASKNPRKYPPGLCRGKVGFSDAIDFLLFTVQREEARKKSYSKSATSWQRKQEKLLEMLARDRLADDGCPNVR